MKKEKLLKPMKKTETTGRGFKIIEGTDYNGVKFSIQESSVATNDVIWFGATTDGVKVFRGDWQDVNLEELLGTDRVVSNRRLHLTREQVKKILPILKQFVKTGYLPEEHEEL